MAPLICFSHPCDGNSLLFWRIASVRPQNHFQPPLEAESLQIRMLSSSLPLLFR